MILKIIIALIIYDVLKLFLGILMAIGMRDDKPKKTFKEKLKEKMKEND